MKITRIFLIAVLMAVVLMACGNGNAVSTTEVTKSTETPTEVPQQFSMNPEKVVDGGFYSYQTIVGLWSIENYGEVTIGTEEELTILTLGARYFEEIPSEDELLEIMMEGFSLQLEDFVSGDPFTYMIQGIEGIAAAYSGRIEGRDVEGSVLLVIYDEGMLFSAYSFSFNDPDAEESRWEQEGKDIYETIMGTIVFHEVDLTATTTECVVSNDPSYGYTEENAIKVGGGSMSGPPRERVFLDTLLGPNGEVISYERLGSAPYEDTILDVYEVIYAGLSEPITLYIDEYTFEDLFAPVGFTCSGPFPLGEP